MAIVNKPIKGGKFLRKRLIHKGPPSFSTRNVHAHPDITLTTTQDVLDSIRRGKERKASYKAARKAAAIEYLAQSATYQLWRGDTPFGAPKFMSNQDRYDANKRYERMFMNDKSPTARLWAWLPEGMKPIPKGTTFTQFCQRRLVKQIAE